MAYILVVDDEPKMRHILRIMLELKGHRVDEAGDGQEALRLVGETPYDLVISDIRMPGMSGMELLEKMKGLEWAPPVVFITAYATVDSAVEAMKAGAVDYITKPFEEERILLTVEKALGLSSLMRENLELRARLGEEEGIVCASEAMRRVLELATRVAAKQDTTVLITGESGTGKELLARYIHRKSPRASGKFVAVNCAAITPSLIESELFGHEKGAFTGADRRKPGVFEFAHRGTLFLDEIGDLPLEAQSRFLRALQEKTVQRVGGNEEISVDVRVICATNQDLEKLVEDGRFRQDLYYRINVFPIEIPPLRERREAVVPLAEHFAAKAFGRRPEGPLFTQGAKRILLEHRWPGNVRELANAVERAVILAGAPPITSEHLEFLRAGKGAGSGTAGWRLPPEGVSLEALEKDLIRQALELTGGNQSAAARLLGLTRSKFRTRLKQLEEGE